MLNPVWKHTRLALAVGLSTNLPPTARTGSYVNIGYAAEFFTHFSYMHASYNKRYSNVTLFSTQVCKRLQKCVKKVLGFFHNNSRGGTCWYCVTCPKFIALRQQRQCDCCFDFLSFSVMRLQSFEKNGTLLLQETKISFKAEEIEKCVKLPRNPFSFDVRCCISAENETQIFEKTS